MDSGKRRLELVGEPFGSVGNSAGSFEVCGGRWIGGGKQTDLCAVIVQRRFKGPCGKETMFKMAIDGPAVVAVRRGLEVWLEENDQGLRGFS